MFAVLAYLCIVYVLWVLFDTITLKKGESAKFSESAKTIALV